MRLDWEKVKQRFKKKNIKQIALIGVVVSGGMLGSLTGNLPGEFVPLIESIDCISGEVFSDDRGICVVDINCEDTGVCAELEAYLQEQSEVSILDIIPERALHTTEELFFETYGTQATILSQYDVSYGKRAVLQRIASNPGRVPKEWRALQGAVLLHDELWDIFSDIVPYSIRSRVTGFDLVSDGLDGMLAAAEPNIKEGTWTILVDVVDAAGEDGHEELIATLIHELAHIITLDTSQRDGEKKDSCAGYEATEIGCLREDAYLSAYVSAFWQPAPFIPLYQVPNPEILRSELTRRYRVASGDFGSAYATMSQEEDIAETFIRFVLAGAEEKEEGIIQEKIDFFYQYPELVELRSYIRGRVLEKI
ncbi:MAG: hypothetical protein ACI83D_000222 [Planctomycetota bacterium]|jgi:hypothetical protein